MREWVATYGQWCPHCGRNDVKLAADHIDPVALGGSEFGEVGVMCVECMRQQASRVGHQARAKARRV